MHGVGAPHAQPVHVRLSTALVPAVLRFAKPKGHSLIPLFATQVWNPPPKVFGAQLWVDEQPVPSPATVQRRPDVSAAACPGVGVHDVGPMGGVAIAWLETETEPPLMGIQPGESTGTVVVAPPVHVESAPLATVKLPVPHEPPALLQEQAHVAEASPDATLRSVPVVPKGHDGCMDAAKRTGVHSGTASWQTKLGDLQLKAPPSPMTPPSLPTPPSLSTKWRSGRELHATTMPMVAKMPTKLPRSVRRPTSLA